MRSSICWSILGAVGIVSGISLMMGSRDLKGLKFINHEMVMQSISTENQKRVRSTDKSNPLERNDCESVDNHGKAAEFLDGNT